MTATKIEWTDAVWNPVTGCSKVSPGCHHCYAEREWIRLGKNPKTVYFGRNFTDVKCHLERIDDPARWRKPRRVFVNSMSDLFHVDVPDWFIRMVFVSMERAHWHTFQVLTKRAERMHRFLNFWPENTYRPAMTNVWLGVSVEDRERLKRLDWLKRTPAAIRFVSFEPLLEDLGTIDFTGINRVIVGGESGPKARPMHPTWVLSIRDQCQEVGTPFFFKQWGEWAPGQDHQTGHLLERDRTVVRSGWFDSADRFNESGPHEGRYTMDRVGKKAAGRWLDGRTWEEMPA